MNLQDMKNLPPEKQKELFKRLSAERKKAKVTVYSATYGIGPPKLSRTLGCTVKEAGELLEAYWERNWAIKKVAEEQEVKIFNQSAWIKNPVSGFWHSLRSDKDRFSTLNQSTGVYCFDTWLAYSRAGGLKVCAQFHDEQLVTLKKGDEEKVKEKLKTSIEKTNKKIKLNVLLDVDTKFGPTYASVH